MKLARYIFLIVLAGGTLYAAETPHDRAIRLCRTAGPGMDGRNLEQCVACITRNDPRMVTDPKAGRNTGDDAINALEMAKTCAACSLYHDITFDNDTNYWACTNRCRFDTKALSDIGKLTKYDMYSCRDCCNGAPTPRPVQFQQDVCPQACMDACTEKCTGHDYPTCDEPCTAACEQKSTDYATLYVRDPDETSFKANNCLKNIGAIQQGIAELKQNIDNYQTELTQETADESTYRYQLDQVQKQSVVIKQALQASLANCQTGGQS